jgi:hypothetical protein
MSASGPWWRREIAVEVDEDGSWEVAAAVRLDAGWPAETPANVEESHASPDRPDK